MFRVAVYIESPRSEQEWSFAVTHFKPDEMYLFKTKHKVTDKPFKHLEQIETLDQLPSDIPIILMAPHNGRYISADINLDDFTHPADAIYVFGANNFHVHEEVFGTRKPDHKVYIETDSHHEMFNYMAYLITAWDRRHG